MASTSRTLVLAAALVAAGGASSLAQETPPAPKPEAPAAPAPSEGAAKSLEQLEALYVRASRRPPRLDLAAAESPEKARAEFARAQGEWERAATALAKAGDDYLASLGDAAPDVRALFFRGVGKFLTGERVGRSESASANEAAAESLQRYLDGAGENAAYATEAEMYLGRALVRAGRVDDAATHLGRAIELLQKDGRHDDAGVCAYDAMLALKTRRRDAELRAFAEAIHASKADFGGSTASVRTLAAGARLAVGAPLPDLPETKDADGRAVSWAPGKPLLLHFFLTGHLNGTPSGFREVELELKPLAQSFGEKGLVLVGVSMDYEMPKAQAEALRKQWDEWGRKTKLRDGSLESVRAWAADQGIGWSWCWDGKSVNNPVSLALGGVGVTQPYAVLVDAKGVVRWHGKAPFEGLAAEVAKLFP